VTLAIVSTGLANIASVRAAFLRLGVEPASTESARLVRGADAVVLPGVGALGPAMARLRERDVDGDTLADALRVRIVAGRPTLVICLGLQLLCAASDEAPGVTALAVADVHVARLDAAPSLPHFGWNEVVPTAGSSLVRRGHAYFAHSYGALTAPRGFDAAWTSHGSPFVAAFERGGVLACQFHPELSGAYGADLLQRWLARAPLPIGAAQC
jgi:glutamine amidotransferase